MEKCAQYHFSEVSIYKFIWKSGLPEGLRGFFLFIPLSYRDVVRYRSDSAVTGYPVIDTGLATVDFLVIMLAVILLNRVKRLSDSFVLILYSLVTVITLAAVLHALYAPYIAGASLLLYGAAVCVLKFPLLALETDGRRGPYLMLSLCVMLFVFQVLQGFIGSQDARVTYLPMSRLLFENPALQTAPYYEEVPSFTNYLGYPPALIGLCTVFYSISGGVSAEIAGLVPALFFIGFLMVLFRWCEEAGAGVVLAAVLLLFSPILIEKCSWFCYESPLLFATTLLFYAMWKFDGEGDDRYLVYAMAGSCMALMFKYTGIFFTSVLVYYVLRNRKVDRRLCILFFVIHAPCIAWYLRNIYYFGSPVSPFLNFLTSDETLRSWLDAAWVLAHREAHRKWDLLFFNVMILPVSLPMLVIWAVIFPFTGLRKNGVHLLPYVLFCAFFPLWLAFNTDMRYLIPFYGAALVQLSIILKDFFERRRLSLSSRVGPAGRVSLFLFFFVLILCLQFVYSKRILPDRISPDMAAIEFLRSNEGAGRGTRVFTDTDHAMVWRARWAVFDPSVPRFGPDFLEARKKREFYGLMGRYDIKYVINHPWPSPWEDDTFSVIGGDSGHFALMLDRGGLKIWKVLH